MINTDIKEGREFFDVDHTITKTSTAISYLILMIKKKLIPASILASVPYVYFNYKYGKMSEKHFNRKIPEMIGIKKETLENIAIENFERFIKKSIYSKSVDFIKKLKNEGKQIVFASSSMDVILKPLATYLGADDVIATKFEYANGVCTGCFDDTPVFKTEKRKRVLEYAAEKNIDLKKSSFYSDSIHDRPLLEEVFNPVAVNPDLRLSFLAKKQGWEILNFKNK